MTSQGTKCLYQPRHPSCWLLLMPTCFSDYFLTHVLRDLGLIPEEPLAFFSRIQMNWIYNECPPCDWFIGRDFSFVWVHGFSEEPFHLPTYVTERTLSLEILGQLVRIDRAIGAGKHDTSIIEDHKAIGPITLIRRSITKNVLTSKLVQLGLVIDDMWSYDPDGCLSKRKNAVSMNHEAHGKRTLTCKWMTQIFIWVSMIFLF